MSDPSPSPTPPDGQMKTITPTYRLKRCFVLGRYAVVEAKRYHYLSATSGHRPRSIATMMRMASYLNGGKVRTPPNLREAK